MRLLVCGSRTFEDKDYLFGRLDRLHAERTVSLVIQGGAPGADTLAYEWALSRNIAVAEYRADWAKHGRAAGPIRNQQMLDMGKPEMVAAFTDKPLHLSRGTAHMYRIARAANVTTLHYIKEDKNAGSEEGAMHFEGEGRDNTAD